MKTFGLQRARLSDRGPKAVFPGAPHDISGIVVIDHDEISHAGGGQDVKEDVEDGVDLFAAVNAAGPAEGEERRLLLAGRGRDVRRVVDEQVDALRAERVEEGGPEQLGLGDDLRGALERPGVDVRRQQRDVGEEAGELARDGAAPDAGCQCGGRATLFRGRRGGRARR